VAAPANVFRIPPIPRFATFEEERRHRKERLAAAFRLFAKFGFDEGAAGHITARDPERPDHFWVNPFGMHFRRVRVSDLILVNAAGQVVEGRHPVNIAAFAIHSSIHHVRPDVIAAAHSHSLYGKAWASLGQPLDPITQDACAFFEDHVVFQDFTGIVYEKSEGERIAEALGNRKAAILRNHGSCHAQLVAQAAGKPVLIARESALATRQIIGTHEAGWFQFQSLWEMITEEQRDLLD